MTGRPVAVAGLQRPVQPGEAVRPGQHLGDADLEPDDQVAGWPRATAAARSGSANRRSCSSPRSGSIWPIALMFRNARTRPAARLDDRAAEPGERVGAGRSGIDDGRRAAAQAGRIGLDGQVGDAPVDVDVEIDEPGHDEQAGGIDDICAGAGGPDRPAPTATIRPPSIATSRRACSPLAGSMTVPPAMTQVVVGHAALHLHRHLGDLAQRSRRPRSTSAVTTDRGPAGAPVRAPSSRTRTVAVAPPGATAVRLGRLGDPARAGLEAGRARRARLRRVVADDDRRMPRPRRRRDGARYGSNRAEYGSSASFSSPGTGASRSTTSSSSRAHATNSSRSARVTSSAPVCPVSRSSGSYAISRSTPTRIESCAARCGRSGPRRAAG